MKLSHKILGCSAFAVVLAFGASTIQAQNLIVNPGFENAGGFTANPITLTSGPGGTSGVGQGWATFGMAQNDMSSSLYSPYAGLETLYGQQAAGAAWNNIGAYQIVPATPGTSYNYSAFALTDTPITGGFGPVDIQLGFQDSAFNTLATFDYGWSPTGTLGTWQQYSINNALAPAGTAYAVAYIFFMDNGSQTAVENLYYDNVSLVPTPEPTTLALAGLGGAAALSLIRRRKS